jgi:cytochrome c oxidase assembly protein subunit 15
MGGSSLASLTILSYYPCMTHNSNKAITLWLLACCAMIFAMAVIGAVTRLTESGLSITEWAPITGTLPPLTDSAWQDAFVKYQAIPQYQLLNRGMSLEEFKTIYFWEWLHRLWGRLIGLVFALPFLYFLIRRQLDKPLAWKLFGILCLGGLQGFVGWFMVQSGLEDRTHVSPYRLAMHLGLALVIYSLLVWVALGLRPRDLGFGIWDLEKKGFKASQDQSPQILNPKSQMLFGWLCLALLALTIVWGAFVAGHRAGLAYNTWPLMEGQFLPVESWTLEPLWYNVFGNTALVQFIHRWLGPLAGLAIVAWALALWRQAPAAQRLWLAALMAMVGVQIALGIATLLTHLNIVLATLHQAGAITLLTLMLVNIWHLFYKK